MRNALTILLFVGVYALTFKPAWRTLSRLIAMSATRRHGLASPKFWVLFVKYRLIIAAPYAVYFVLGRDMPTALNRILASWLLLGLALGMLRFVGTERTKRFLWWAYGFVYDGLLRFYPYRNLVAAVVGRLELAPGMRVLELGCGTGNVVAAALAAADVTVVGVDGSASMLARARRKLASAHQQGRVHLIQGDLMEYLKRQPDSCFDRISLVNVIYAVPDRAELWRECRRVLVSGGRIVATTSDRTGSKSIIREHLANARWRELLSIRLVAVAVIDYFISELARSKVFSFPEQSVLLDEVRLVGGEVSQPVRIYGGSEAGVNILFSIA